MWKQDYSDITFFTQIQMEQSLKMIPYCKSSEGKENGWRNNSGKKIKKMFNSASVIFYNTQAIFTKTDV